MVKLILNIKLVGQIWKPIYTNGAARLLGVPKSTLQYRLKKYNIKAEKYSN